MKHQCAPIAFFTYRRPEQTLKSLTSLMNNAGASESELFIFCDGPKTELDEPAVCQVRRVVRSRQWCRRVHVIEQATNQGVARSVMGGVTQLVEEFDRVIVVEDDLLVSRGFLDYMNRALEKYASEENVLQISGHMFPIRNLVDDDDAFFMPMVTSWGWATWRRAWRHFDPYATGYEALKHDEDLRNKFDLSGSYPYTAMLLAQMAGEIDSWAIRWWWSVFRNQGLSLYPKISLIMNTGFATAATHTKGTGAYYNDPDWAVDRAVVRLPRDIVVDQANFVKVRKHLAVATRRSGWRAMGRRIKNLMRRSLNYSQ